MHLSGWMQCRFNVQRSRLVTTPSCGIDTSKIEEGLIFVACNKGIGHLMHPTIPCNHNESCNIMYTHFKPSTNRYMVTLVHQRVFVLKCLPIIHDHCQGLGHWSLRSRFVRHFFFISVSVVHFRFAVLFFFLFSFQSTHVNNTVSRYTNAIPLPL